MVIKAEFDPNVEGTCPIEAVGWPSMMMHARASKAYYPKHIGPLSIKTVSAGAETYIVEGQQYKVTPDSYLILNHGQHYASHILAETGVESFCLFFAPGLVEEVLGGLILPGDHLLDDPLATHPSPISFIEKLYDQDDILTPLINSIKETTQEGPVTKGWLEEQYRFLLERLVTVHRKVGEEITKISAVKHSTRVELYRRIHRAKDFMDSTLAEGRTLGEMAEIACLSPHHFLRVFKNFFGMTPHKYLSYRKMEWACHLLKQTRYSVSEICTKVGFESLGTFSRVFKDRYGLSPVQYRRMK